MSGVLGVYSVKGESVADDLVCGLIALQHRGEEGCGVSVARESSGLGFYRPYPRSKLVHYFFRDGARNEIRRRQPRAGIGHVLYENTGSLQPENRPGITHQSSIAMDGVLPGFYNKNEGFMRALFQSYLDQFASLGIEGSEAFFKSGEKVMDVLWRRGSYCVTALVDIWDDQYLVAFRDPRGIKPLAIGGKDGKIIVASETKAFESFGADWVRDVTPGEMVLVSDKGLDTKVLRKDEHAHCAFEWVYFADPCSTIEGRNVYEMRKAMGGFLADRYPLPVDIVVASPDSGRGVAIGYQQALSRNRERFIPFEEAIIKNPGAKRTFQVENEDERRLAANTKFYTNTEVVKDKRVACGDDSIVRGTVFRDGIVRKLKEAGAKEVYAIISCPPLRYPCIKDPTSTNFAAQGMDGTVEEVGRRVAKKLNMDGVCYPTIEELDAGIGMTDTCKACFDGKYPVDCAGCNPKKD